MPVVTKDKFEHAVKVIQGLPKEGKDYPIIANLGMQSVKCIVSCKRKAVLLY